MDAERNIEFLPFELALLTKLAEVLRILDGRFKAEEVRLNKAHQAPLPLGYEKRTKVSAMLATLKADQHLPSEQAMRALAAWIEKDESDFQALTLELSKDPVLLSKVKEATKSAVETLITDANTIFDAIGNAGLPAYEAAGGNVLRDLFEEDGGGWLEDVALLERLVAERLRTEAETVAAENWKWIEIAASFPYGHDHGLRRLEGTPPELSDEEQASLGALQAKYDALQAKYEDADELPDKVDARLGELEEALEAFENRPDIFKPAEIVHAGAFVSIDAEGALHVERGYVRREDEAAFVVATAEPNPEAGAATPSPDDGCQSAPAVQGSVITMAGQAPPDEEEDDAIRPLPDRLVMELTAHRTLALRDAVASHP